MQGFFNPASVAVVGVSPRPGNLARNIVENLDLFGFQGPVYPLGRKPGEFAGRQIYTDPADLPETPELGVILTPAATVPGYMRALAERGCRRVVVESGGFSELASERGDLEAELKAIAQEYDLRFIGPNCIGVINTHSGVAVPFPIMVNAVPKGGVSIVAQSGGIGLTYLYACAGAGMGVACFASVGNKLNVNERDLLAHLVEDPNTEVILLYLESVVAGREIFDLIRGCPKPVVVHKSNIASTSHAIAQSHTTALANDDAVVDAALEQAGAVRARTVTEAITMVKGLALPRPKGRRLAVISRSGGHAVVAADACFRQGMELPPFPPEYVEPIAEVTRAGVIKLQNPLDLGDLFAFQIYKDILEGALKLDNVDGVVFAHGYRGPEAEGSRKFIQAAGELCRQYDKPVGLVLLADAEENLFVSGISSIPIFPFPDEALLALSTAEKARRPKRPAPSDLPELDQERITRILGTAGPDGSLELPEALHLARAAGIAVAEFAVVMDAEEARQASRQLPAPQVLKAVAPGLSHKSDSGGVVLDLADEDAVAQAAEAMLAELKPSRMVLMAQASGAAEVIVGGRQDQAFGALVLAGLGGVTAEVLRDTCLRLAPVSDDEAGEMLASLRGAPLLSGYRGQPAVDLAALREVIVRVGVLVSRFPALKELDLNPLLAGPQGVVAVDARATVKA